MERDGAVAVVGIVDDDAAVRRALRRLVQSLGLRAETFAAPQELLDSGRAGSLDCLVLDVRLPGMDGFELRRRASEVRADAPVIFITSDPDPLARARAREMNAVALLAKPFDDAVLVEALLEALVRSLDRP